MVGVAGSVDAAAALHGKRGGGGLVEGGEFLVREPAGQQQGPDGDEGHDEDGKADGGDGLGDGKGGAEADELDGDEEPDGAAAANLEEGVGRRGEGLVAAEEDELGGDAVGLEGLDAHDEEEAGKHAVGDEVQADEQRPRHGAEGEEALGEVGEALLDDVRGLGEVAALVLALFVDVLDGVGDAEGFGVEGGLGDEAVGEGQAQDAGDAGGEAEEEEVPVEAGGFSEGELGALGDEGRDLRGAGVRI